MSWTYTEGDELGDAGATWLDTYGSLIDLSTGYTFVLTVYNDDGTAAFTKSSGITGAAGSLTSDPPTPNVTVAWATSGELSTLSPGTFPVRIVATRSADSKTRTFRTRVTILPRNT